MPFILLVRTPGAKAELQHQGIEPVLGNQEDFFGALTDIAACLPFHSDLSKQTPGYECAVPFPVCRYDYRMDTFLTFLREGPLWLLALLALAENTIILLGAVGVGEWLTRRFGDRPVVDAAPPVDATQIVFATSAVLLNSLITFLGLLLWRAGIIQVRADTHTAAVLVDFLRLVFMMDVCMYVLHRVAHLPVFFRLIHRTHHHYDNPRPLILFVLNPLEVLGFGLLWLILLCCYDATWLGMSLYLAFNVLFGVIGHIGVEPVPDRWKRVPVLRYLATSSFHAGHHQHEGYNFGFYTLIWDRIFGTLSPNYENDFGRPPTSSH